MRSCLPAALLLSVMPVVAAAAHAQETTPPGTGAQSALAPEYLTVEQLRARYADKASRYMTIRGVEVHYKDEGRGPVLLMVHGSQGSLRTWDRIAARLKSHYRIVRFDVPGYGLSGSVSDEAAANVNPADIAEGLVDALGITRLTGVGVSSGGTMVAYLAASRPELVERLVLSNMPSDQVNTGRLAMPAPLAAAVKRSRETGYFDQDFWVQFLGFFSGDPARISKRTLREYWDFNRRTPERHPNALVAQVGDGVQARAEMARIVAPTLLIWGTADQLLPESAATALAAALPNARVSRVTMPDVGHYPPVEVPYRFAEAMTQYLERGSCQSNAGDTAERC